MTILPTLLILAAGSGSRYRASGGQTHKLDALINGSSVLKRAMRAAEQSGLAWHVVRAADVPQGSVGMGDSIATGARATANATGWLIIPGDLPLVLPATLQRVAHALATGTHDVVTPLFRGRQGHPVGFSASCLTQLTALSGDRGASSIVQEARSHHRVLTLDVGDDEGIVTDIDTVDDLLRAQALHRQRTAR